MFALQETWNIKYPDLLDIPGYQHVIFTSRNNNNNGGGVGFYVRNGLTFKQNNTFVTNQNNMFESVSIEIQYPHRSLVISNIYRCPTAPPNIPNA